MTTLPAITKSNGRLHHPDGTFADYITLRFPPNSLNFRDIDQSEPQVKLQDIAHLRYYQARERGEDAPIIIAFLLLEQDRPVEQIFPGISSTTPQGETLLSANSFITHTLRELLSRGWLHYENKNWQVAAPKSASGWQERGQAVINLLISQDRLLLYPGPDRLPPARPDLSDFPVYKNLIPIGGCAFLSDLVWRERPRLVFDAAFFLLEHDDFFSHHSALGEAYNLWVSGGIIHRPPLYRRGAIFHSDRWQIAFLGLDDLEITLPTGLDLRPRDLALAGKAIPFTLNDDGPSDLTLYTRYYGVSGQGRVLGHTPAAPDRFELTVIDRRVVSWQRGGKLALPQNGFIISFAPNVLSDGEQRELQKALRTQPLLDYRFARPQHQSINQAIQIGPILLQDGRSPLTNTYLEEREQFWPSRNLDNGHWQIGVVSTDYKTDIDQSRHARVGLGIDKNGDLILVMVACVKPALRVPGVESAGATLTELASLLAEAGAVDALNLDGGGSAQAYYMGGRAIVPGDRRGLPLIHYERMVPSVGVVL
ncbi:MAG: hypothetical protein B6I34_07490 [Anaerolineaceae bacterium 4572_32.1]|nr:MAG: hypothetical protein B6I34_07490 [Anaerolineaceae bacterium 4572_32.1]